MLPKEQNPKAPKNKKKEKKQDKQSKDDTDESNVEPDNRKSEEPVYMQGKEEL